MTPIAPETLRRYLGPGAVELLQQYFLSGLFTGGRFERVAGGGDRPDVVDRFTTDDVVAASMLSVRLPGRTSLELLEQRSGELNVLLAQIPHDLDLWEAGDDTIGPGSAAWELWSELKTIPDAGWVTAGKLLARKRPRLIPVYDRVVKTALARADDDEFWRPLRDVLRDDPTLRTELVGLRRDSGVGDDISVLRVLDVAIWMGAQGKTEPVPDPES